MNLIKSTGTFGFYTIISRILGYLRDILIAIFLGTGFVADAFFVAFRIPNTFRRLFAEGTFNAAFVPSYTSELAKSKLNSSKFAGEILKESKLVEYKIDMKKIIKRGVIVGVGDGIVEVDGKQIYSAESLKVGLIK